MREQSVLETATSGSIRFNTDSSKLEIYDGNAWFEIDATSPELESGGTRGLVSGGYISANTNAINFVNISTTGDASDFGDLTEARRDHGAVASRVRGVFGIGYASANSNVLDFVRLHQQEMQQILVMRQLLEEVEILELEMKLVDFLMMMMLM